MPVYKDTERGTWFFEFRKVINGITYKRKRRGFNTKAAAQNAEYKMIESLKDEKSRNLLSKKVSTLNNIFESFVEYKKMKIRITTLDGHIIKFRKHIGPVLGKMQISQITPETVRKWKVNFISNNFSNSFTNQTIALFKNILEYAITRGYPVNPDVIIELDRVAMQKVAIERDVWTQEEMDQFLNSFDLTIPIELDYYQYFYAFSKSGMRPNEFRALQVQDIQGEYLNVNKDITSKVTGMGDIIQPPKNQSSIRKVIMPNDVIEMLLNRTKGYKPTDFIFGKDKAFRESNIRRALDVHAKAANVKHIVIYGFRHSHATHLIRSGVPIKVVSQRLGHKDITTTINTYWHLLKEDERKALEALKSNKNNVF